MTPGDGSDRFRKGGRSAMSEHDPGKLSALLVRARKGDAEARDELFAAMYGEMRRMAGELMRRERPGHTLQPSALVNEAVMRLLKGGTIERAEDRRYLFAAAALAMRRTLVDYARKPGARVFHEALELDQIVTGFGLQNLDIVALHEALERLSAIDERRGMVVTLRFFGGLTIDETAEILDVSTATVEGDWRFARAWLRSQLGGPCE
jgi:RNA polymerase sigma factor (TIGR02999 family)